MDEVESLKCPDRPTWEFPNWLIIVALVLSTGLGLLGIGYGASKWLKPLGAGIFWALVVIPIGAVVLWALRGLIRELRVPYFRVKHYLFLYDKSLALIQQLKDSDRRLSWLFQQIVRAELPSRSQLYSTHRPLHSIIKDADLYLTLDETSPERINPSDFLVVMDPNDGKWLGNLEVTSERTPTNHLLAKLTQWDAMFLTSVRSQAEQRQELNTRAMAYRFNPGDKEKDSI